MTTSSCFCIFLTSPYCSLSIFLICSTKDVENHVVFSVSVLEVSISSRTHGFLSWRKAFKQDRSCLVTNNPQISGAEDNFLAHTMSTPVRLEALQCVSLILRTRRMEQPLSGTLLVIVAGGKSSEGSPISN